MRGPHAIHEEPSRLPKDIFLSHRSADKEFVRMLATDLESQSFQGRGLTTWVDEAEIQSGSIPGKVNEGLENSRFVALVMTPSYFDSESGWTDAEWHAALHRDPNNRLGRIIPLLVKDCPYIPVLLRHLRIIDFRGKRYSQGLQELLRVLRQEPVRRPLVYRGQLVTPEGRIDGSTLSAERATLQCQPDVAREELYCNLLSVDRLPQHLYTARIAGTLRQTGKGGTRILPTKQEIKEAVRQAQDRSGVFPPFVPAFRTHKDRIITFHDLESPNGALAPAIREDSVEVVPMREFIQYEDDRKIVVSLLNMAIARHANRVGLVIDETKQGRFFFPPKDGGPNVIEWTPLKRKASRTVAKPCTKDGQVMFWRHLGAYLRLAFLAQKFFVKITPTWVITEDGATVRRGPGVGRLVVKWTGPERNLHILYHVRFWTAVLQRTPGPISIRTGDQSMELSTIPAFVQSAYGIADDRKDLMKFLDQRAMLIAKREDELADIAVEAELAYAKQAGPHDDLPLEEREEAPSDEDEI